MTPHALAVATAAALTSPRPTGAGLRWRRALDVYGRPGYVPAPAPLLAPRVVVIRVPLDSGDVPAALRPATADLLAAALGSRGDVRVTRDREFIRVEIPRPDGGVPVALPATGDAIAVAAGGRWLALALDDHAPHALVAGATGSGKTTACAALALVESRRARVIVVNPKSAPEYAPLGWLGHTVAVSPADIAAALAWAAGRIGQAAARVVVIVDEWTLLDAEARAACERIATLGRAADLHLVIGTQYPRADIVSTITRLNADRVLVGTMEPAASRAILGDASAAGLLGRGDMLIGQRSGSVERVQVARVRDDDWATAGMTEALDIAPAPAPAPRPVHPSQAPTPTPPAWHAWIIDRARETGSWPGALLVGDQFECGTGRARRVLAEARALVGENTGIPGGAADVAPGRVVGSIAAR